jgi:arginine utilization protein RocB
VGSEEKTNTYEETVSRTTSEPAAEATPTDEAAITTAPAGDIETYEVQSVTTPEEESVSTKAREAGRSLKELMSSLGRKTKEATEEKARELKAQSVDISAKTDAHDIQHLGDDVEKLITVFEDTMTEIRKEPYDEQEKLLVGYKKLLEEQINVINARLSMAKRLKPGA